MCLASPFVFNGLTSYSYNFFFYLRAAKENTLRSFSTRMGPVGPLDYMGNYQRVSITLQHFPMTGGSLRLLVIYHRACGKLQALP
jgi:hypothetical protein